MSTHSIGHVPGAHVDLRRFASRHAAWLALGFAAGFLVPFVLADLLELPRDLYYGLYALAVVALLAGWARATGVPLGRRTRLRLLPATLLGLAFAAGLAVMVLRVEDATARPDGLELAWAVAWRGVVYGAADGLLLSAFPILVAFAWLSAWRSRHGRRGTVAVGAAALAASLALTAVYHLGYQDFRSSKLRQPVAGDTVWSVPTLVTLNPVGAPIAHAGMHVAAVLHSSETETFLPPHR